MSDGPITWSTRETFDSDLSAHDRERYWGLVSATLTTIFSGDLNALAEYRTKVERHPRSDARIAAYHTSPLIIAADLAGWRDPIGEAKLDAFLDLARRSFPESVAGPELSRMAAAGFP